MKSKHFLILIALFAFGYGQAQDQEKYQELIREAWALYEAEDYLASAQQYSAAFVALGGKGYIYDRYNAACSWALAGQPDSAFVQLLKLAENPDYTDYGHLTTDTDLNTLHEDERWAEVTAKVLANKEKMEANYDKPLVAMLDTIYEEDQKYRRQIGAIEKEHGRESDEMQAHWALIIEKDSINLIKVERILEERGWLGPDVIGSKGNSALFLVIQHADIAVQEKYLPMMREAAAQGNARPSSLALLEDRVALRTGKRQIYGSQIGRDKETGEYYVLPLEDPDKVDERRAEVGLGPLQDYVGRWGLTWDAEAYKALLPTLEAKD